jgi:hypothetical protein
MLAQRRCPPINARTGQAGQMLGASPRGRWRKRPVDVLGGSISTGAAVGPRQHLLLASRRVQTVLRSAGRQQTVRTSCRVSAHLDSHVGEVES